MPPENLSVDPIMVDSKNYNMTRNFWVCALKKENGHADYLWGDKI
jgi:hypothetical protein